MTPVPEQVGAGKSAAKPDGRDQSLMDRGGVVRESGPCPRERHVASPQGDHRLGV